MIKLNLGSRLLDFDRIIYQSIFRTEICHSVVYGGETERNSQIFFSKILNQPKMIQ